MKVLYYCPEYYYRHGGRTHARGFFSALKDVPLVSASFLYPKVTPSGIRHADGGADENPVRDRLWLLPGTLRRIIRFFMPRHKLTRALIREISTHECDTIVIRTGSRQPSIRAIKKACPGVSVCLEINSALFDEKFRALPLRPVFQRWEVSRFVHADAIVVVSAYLKSYLVKYGVAPEKVLVNQNGVDINAVDRVGKYNVREQYGISPDAFVLGYIGGMEPFRRLPEVISYIANMRSAGNEDMYFLVVGDGEDMPLVKAAIEAEKNALDNAVKLVGWVEHSEIPEFLASFDLAIFPFTNAYCSPLKLFEYLAAGIPAVGPETPAVKEVFENNAHLKLVKQDGSNFTDVVLELKANPKFRRKMAERGRKLVMEKYTWKKNAENVVRHIEDRRRFQSCQGS